MTNTLDLWKVRTLGTDSTWFVRGYVNRDVGRNETKEGRGGKETGEKKQTNKKKKKIREAGKKKKSGVLDQISNVHGHFLHSGVVEGLNVPERALVILSDHVDSDTLSAETTTTTNSTQKKPHC